MPGRSAGLKPDARRRNMSRTHHARTCAPSSPSAGSGGGLTHLRNEAPPCRVRSRSPVTPGPEGPCARSSSWHCRRPWPSPCPRGTGRTSTAAAPRRIRPAARPAATRSRETATLSATTSTVTRRSVPADGSSAGWTVTRQRTRAPAARPSPSVSTGLASRRCGFVDDSRMVAEPGVRLGVSTRSMAIEIRGEDAGSASPACREVVTRCSCSLEGLDYEAAGQEYRPVVTSGAVECRICPIGADSRACQPGHGCTPTILSVRPCAPATPAPRKASGS